MDEGEKAGAGVLRHVGAEAPELLQRVHSLALGLDENLQKNDW